MSELMDALSAMRASSALLERAHLTLSRCEDIDEDTREDLTHHARQNRVHVDLTAGRLHAVIAHGCDLE